ncbi:MAG: glutamine synthetase [Spirochaetes bacterium]|nr:glutamine synthetase [Spirochaetota bacterium]
MEQDKEFILRTAKDKNVKFIRLWFTDVLGLLKSFAITIEELEDALVEGVRFDASTLDGFIRTEEHELLALPDPSTFKLLPWRPQSDSVARMFCDIYKPDMTPYEGDSRYILKKNLKRAAEKGFTFYTGPEIEFFFFKNQTSTEVIDTGGYFDLTPLDSASDFRRQTVLTLESMGMDILSSHHEGANSQHEIDLRHEDALTTADNIMTFRVVTKEIAQKNSIYASFMPKPIANQNGSGMHIHMSLFKDEENIFYDKTKDFNLSDDAKYFIAGILKHCNEFFAVTNQWINSYKRFVYGFEAPTFASWSTGFNSSLIRIPEMRKDRSKSMRIELRNPDPSCNPYLAFSAIISAGLEGIEKKYKLAPPLHKNISNLSLSEIADMNILPLPTHLSEALTYFKNSELMKNTLGELLMNKFIENKKHELFEFNRHVTDFEISKYLPIL